MFSYASLSAYYVGVSQTGHPENKGTKIRSYLKFLVLGILAWVNPVYMILSWVMKNQGPISDCAGVTLGDVPAILCMSNLCTLLGVGIVPYSVISAVAVPHFEDAPYLPWLMDAS